MNHARCRRPSGRFFNDMETVLNEVLGQASTNMKSHPPTNVKETENGYELQVVVPGYTKDDFNITLDGKVMTVSSEVENTKEETNENFKRREYVQRSFSRSFTLPDSVDTDQISVGYDNGILNFSLVNKPEMTPDVKKISVQ